jgi:hypothetical protein
MNWRGGSHHPFSGEIFLDLAPIMIHGIAYEHDQFFLSTLPLEVKFSFNNSGAVAAGKSS